MGEAGERKSGREQGSGGVIDNCADRSPVAMLSVAVQGDRASPRETALPLATVPAHTPHLVGSPTLGQGVAAPWGLLSDSHPQNARRGKKREGKEKKKKNTSEKKPKKKAKKKPGGPAQIISILEVQA